MKRTPLSKQRYCDPMDGRPDYDMWDSPVRRVDHVICRAEACPLVSRNWRWINDSRDWKITQAGKYDDKDDESDGGVIYLEECLYDELYRWTDVCQDSCGDLYRHVSYGFQYRIVSELNDKDIFPIEPRRKWTYEFWWGGSRHAALVYEILFSDMRPIWQGMMLEIINRYSDD